MESQLKLGHIITFDYEYESGLFQHDVQVMVKAIDSKRIWAFKYDQPFLRARMSNIEVHN